MTINYVRNILTITAQKETKKEINKELNKINKFIFSKNNVPFQNITTHKYSIDSNTIKFSTAWRTPFTIILYLSQKFPTTKFSIEYADEDLGENCGSYACLNNDIINEKSLKAGTELAINFSNYVNEIAE